MNKSDEIKIKKLLADYNPKQSDFQIENFIVRSSGDSWAQYKKALREIDGRYENLIDLNNRKVLADFRRKRKRFYNVFSRFSKIKYFLGKKVSKTAYENLIKEIKNVENELSILVDVAAELKEEIGHITDERRQELELKSWTAKAYKIAAIDLMAYGRISTQTFEFIFSLPRESRVKVLAEFQIEPPKRLTE